MDTLVFDAVGRPTPRDAEAAREAGLFAYFTDSPLTRAFTKKRTVHAGMSGIPLKDSDAETELARLRSIPRTEQSAAYVHIPYCSSKCLYCGFFGGRYSRKTGACYLDALLWEIEAETAYASTGGTPINALYLGGGTPTELQPDELCRLLNALRDHLPLANDCELTVEARIHSFTPEKMEACMKGGVSRFSLGIQSFNTRTRRLIGRSATREQAIEGLKRLAAYNEAAVIIDLIYGLPGQSLLEWQDDVKTCIDLPLDGVDLYQLNVFPGSDLHKAVQDGQIPPTASLEEQGAYFTAGVEIMQHARCRRLSLSHWGITGRERNMYNPLAKKKADCLHFGSGSGGSLQGYFMYNQPDPAAYIESCAKGRKPVIMVVSPSIQSPIMKFIIEQMEECRLNLDALDKRLENSVFSGMNLEAAVMYAPLLENWEEAGLIQRNGSWVELTLAGQFWQVNLTQALLDWNTQLLSKRQS